MSKSVGVRAPSRLGPMRADPNEHQLGDSVTAASDGDQLLEALHRKHFHDVWRFLYRRLRDRVLAEDLAQETFLRAYRSRETFDRDRPAWPWLATIAHNVLLNAVRDNARRVQATSVSGWEALEGYADSAVELGPESSYFESHRRETITTALNHLTPRQRRILVLRCVEELSYDQIASSEGLTLDALKSVLKRARHAFRLAYRSLEEAELPVVFAHRWGRFRSRVERLRMRTIDAVHSLHASASAPSLMEALAIVSAVGVLVVPPTMLDPGRPGTQRTANHASREIALEGADGHSADASSSSERPSSSTGSVETKPKSMPVAVTATFKKDERKRTAEVSRRQQVPGREDEGAVTRIELPCLAEQSDVLCESLDRLPMPYGTGR